MRVALVTVYSHSGCTLKDVAGGYGTVFEVGRSWRARALERAKSRVAILPSLVQGYLAAQLGAAGHSVSVEEIRERWTVPDVDVAVVLSSMVDAEAERDYAAYLRSRGVRTIVVGAFASAQPLFYRDHADVVIVGEPEALGAALLDAGDGVVRVGEVANLDALPFPDWTAFDVARFRYAFLGFRSPTLPIGSARGCAYGCGYCPWRVTASFRQRDPARVGREIEHQQRRHGARSFAFRDPLFNLDEDRVLELTRVLRPLGIRFSAEMRADRLSPRLLEALGEAGLRSLEIGVESVNREMLAKEKRRPPDAAQVEETVRTAQRLGIRVICNFILGLPDDDRDTMQQTLQWARRLDSFAAQFTIATPYPGTTLEARVDRLPVAASSHTGFRPTFRHPRLSSDELEGLREQAYVEHYFRPRYALRFVRHAVPALLDELTRSHG